MLRKLIFLSSLLAASPSLYTTGDYATTGTFGMFSVMFALLSVVFSCILPVGMFAVFAVLMVLWILMLIDVIRREDDEFGSAGKDQKLLWLLIVILTSYLGAAIYYFLVYRKYPLKKK